jgi:hypothetical protein
LLWQLLAGRPPYITADPLAKLAAHQTRTIDDVRVWAPDTPALLAETICRLTSPEPVQRPRSFDEVLQLWGTPSSFSRSRLRQFRRLFEGAVPHFAGPISNDSFRSWIWTALVMFIVIGGMTAIYDKGLRKELLEIARNVKASTESPKVTASANLDPSAGPANEESSVLVRKLLPLPKPSTEGVILLTEHGPYEGRAESFDGHLIIRGTIGVSSEIRIENTPMSLSADEVTFEQVRILQSTETDFVASVTVRSQRLRVVHCEFLESDASDSEGDSERYGIAAIAWTTTDPRSAQSGRIEIENSFFHGTGPSILFAQPPRSIQIENTLKTGRGVFLSLGPKCLVTEMTLELNRVTLRDSGSLLSIAGNLATTSGSPPVQIQSNNSVFKFVRADSGLIVMESDQSGRDVGQSIELRAEESVVEPVTILVGRYNQMHDRFEELDGGGDLFEGLVASEIKFAGHDLHRAVDSKTTHLQGPRSSENTHCPGIDPQRIGLTKRP